MGSVKDLEIINKPTKTSMGTGRFHFSDRYSVFDWGEMPDHIEGKRASLCLQGAYCFEKLEEKGITTHYEGLVNEKGKIVSFEEAEPTVNTMEIKLVNVYKPRAIAQEGKLKYDYSTFTPNLNNFLIPLEVVYRNGLPAGSSVFKRLEQGITTINDLGLDHYPSPGERLAKPIFDASTKLEEKDRYVTWEEAQKLARLTDDELDTIKDILLKVDQTITEIALGADLDNEDGKIELAFDTNRRLMVVDVVGTLDECRFTYNGLQVSKEIARQFYRKTEWFNDIEEAKKAAEAKGIADWKSLCKTQPPKLDPQLKRIISQMYMAAANEMTNRRMFEMPRLAEIVKEYREYEEKKR
jgi:phosphoribosylaminoimidazole-succinocarboxamide synthase